MLAAALSPTRVLALGDEQYQNGNYSGFTHAYKRSWGKLRSITWPVPGNHEYETAGARGYYRYFKYRQPGTPGYYRRALNGWQLFFLNSNCRKISCATERAWLERELTAHPSTCALMAFHHPRFSSGGEHGSSRAMKPVLGHRLPPRRGHRPVRARPRLRAVRPDEPDGALDPAHGIVQFVSGLGGRSLYPRGTTVPGIADLHRRPVRRPRADAPARTATRGSSTTPHCRYAIPGVAPAGESRRVELSTPRSSEIR